MKNTLNLSIIYFKEALRNFFKGKKKSGTATKIAVFTFIVLLMAFAFGYNFYNMAVTLNQFNLAHNIMIVGLLFSLFIVLMFTISDTQGSITRTKDIEMLMSFPLKPVQIMTAKFLGAYLVNLLYTSIISIPTFVVYFMFCEINIWPILFAILSLPFLALFSQLVSSLFALLVNLVTAKLNNKNIVRTVVSVIFAIGIMALIYLANSNTLTTLFSYDCPMWIRIVFPYIYFLQKTITFNKYIYFVYFVLVSILYAVVSVGLLLLTINTNNIKTKSKTKAKKDLSFEKKSVLDSLLKKETKTFFSSVPYCLNGIMGPLLTVLMSVICVGIYQDIKSFEFATNIFVIIQTFSVAMCVGMAPTTAVSISIEGKKFETIKSLPISANKVVWSKILFNIILNLPFLILSELIFVFAMKLNAVVAIVSILYLLSSLFLYTVLGSIMNLKFPKLVWTNENQAVKQGASLILTMLIDLLVSIAPMIIYFSFTGATWFKLVWFILATLAIVLVLATILTITLIKNTQKWYKKVS